MSDHGAAAEDWIAGPEAEADQQRRAWLQSTPAQRLEWLQQAIAFAHQAGAVPGRPSEE